MKIYLNRDKSEENSRYIVYTETFDEMYRIVGKHNRSSQHFYIMKYDKCIAKIRESHLAMLRSCYVSTLESNFHIAITNTKDKFKVSYHGVPLHLRGDVLNKTYDILDVDNTVIACVCRRFSKSHDALEININDNKYETLSIATAVCLNDVCTMDSLVLQAT